jgi:glycosyltransferase involved in cell wall biosynthesis
VSEPAAQPDALDLSVLIATRDRARLLGETLALLGRQEVGGLRWEVVVVDNGSVDETPSVLERACAAGDLPLRVLREPEPGKSAALNRGLGAVRGRLLVFTDDDVAPSPRWLAELYDASLRWPDYDIFCGPIIPNYPPDLPDWFDPERPYTVGAYARFRLKQDEGPLRPGVLPFGPNYAVRARAIAGMRYSPEVGPKGSEYPMGEETEMLQRLTARGERGVYVPAAVVEHHVDPSQLTPEWLFGRAFRLGRGYAHLENDRESFRLFGAPWYAWTNIAPRCVKFALRRSGGARVEAGWKLYLACGRLREYRLLSKRRGRAHGAGAAAQRNS